MEHDDGGSRIDSSRRELVSHALADVDGETWHPSLEPTWNPTVSPTGTPTSSPMSGFKYPTLSPTERPTDRPTLRPTRDLTRCVDSPTWRDADGDTCAHYRSRWCRDGNPLVRTRNGTVRTDQYARYADRRNKTALDACCICGGGVWDCLNNRGWTDIVGRGCNTTYYANLCGNGRDVNAGRWNIGSTPRNIHAVARDLVSAMGACCKCGGGSQLVIGGRDPDAALRHTTPEPSAFDYGSAMEISNEVSPASRPVCITHYLVVAIIAFSLM